MRCLLGVDPGQHGALAALSLDGEQLQVWDMPLAGKEVLGAELARIIEEAAPVEAVVELVSSMPKQGVASSFKFGYATGIVIGALAALRIRTWRVPPSRWKADLKVTADKEVCRLRAIQMWPECSHELARKRDADRAEAALLAFWLLRQRRSTKC